MSERPPVAVTVIKMAWCCLLAAVLAAALMFPVVGGLGLVSNRASDVVANGSSQLVEGDIPAVSTMVDARGNVLAWLYSQRRFEVTSDQIADTMKLAIVSIEDKRFDEHNGVDWQGTLTGLSGYLANAADTRGGSTIEQQYIKNYQLLVTAQTDAERRAAIETTPARKLREIRMALTLDKTFTKPEILTRYLNLVSFGNGAYGIQDAAQTYFGVDASQLNWQQAALLAGLVQSTSALNPYTNPEGALARRNLVLDTMIENLPANADELRLARCGQPLDFHPLAAFDELAVDATQVLHVRLEVLRGPVEDLVLPRPVRRVLHQQVLHLRSPSGAARIGGCEEPAERPSHPVVGAGDALSTSPCATEGLVACLLVDLDLSADGVRASALEITDQPCAARIA